MRRNRLVNEQKIRMKFRYIPENPIDLLLKHRGKRRSQFKETHGYKHSTYYDHNDGQLARIVQGVNIWATSIDGEYRYEIVITCIAQNEQSAQIACKKMYEEWYKKPNKVAYNMTTRKYEDIGP